VEIKFEGETYNISQDMWDAMNVQAAEWGMDMTEYIAEAFTKLKNESEPKQHLRGTTKTNNL
jgi:hypothetical protein